MKIDETKPAADSNPDLRMALSDEAKQRGDKEKRDKIAAEAKERGKVAPQTREKALQAKATEEQEQEDKAAAAQRATGELPQANATSTAPTGARTTAAPRGGAAATTTTAAALVKVSNWKQPPTPAQNKDINSVAISGNGSRVIAGTFFLHQLAGGPVTEEVACYIRDASGNPTPNGDHLFNATAPALNGRSWTRGGIQSVAISRDGTWAACGGGMTEPNATPPDAGFIYTYDVAAGTRVPIFINNFEVQAVALSNDGKYLVAGADRVYVYQRNGTTWTELPLPSPDPIGGKVRRVAISGDGKWIVVSVEGGTVGLIRNQGGTLKASGTWKAPNPYWVLGVAVADGGAAFSAAVGNGRLYYFSTSDVVENTPGKLTFSESWNRKIPTCSSCRWAAMSDDGSLVATIGGVDKQHDPTRPGIVALYRHNGAQPPTDVWPGNIKTLDGPNSVAIDSTGTYVTAADGTPSQARGGFYLFHGATGAPQWVPPGNYPTTYMNYHMALSADGKAAVGGSNNGHFYYFAVP